MLERVLGKGNTSALPVGVQTGKPSLNISMDISQKNRRQLTSGPSNTTFDITQRILNFTTRISALEFGLLFQ